MTQEASNLADVETLQRIFPTVDRLLLVEGTASDDPIAYVVAGLSLDRVLATRVGKLMPGVLKLPGPGPHRDNIPSLIRLKLIRHTNLTWAAFAGISVGEVLDWPGVGEGKVRTFIEFLAREIHERTFPGSVGQLTDPQSGFDDGERHGLVEALRQLAAWAISREIPDLIEALNRARTHPEGDTPLDAVDYILTTDMAQLAGNRVRQYDADAMAAEFLKEFQDERDRTILIERVLAGTEKATLEDLAQRYGLSRERIRQLETRVVEDLERLRRLDRYGAVERRARLVREEVGVATLVDLAPNLIQPDDGSQVDDLIRFLAGPYDLTGDWLMLRDAGRDPFIAALESLRSLFENGSMPLELALEALAEDGWTEESAGAVIDRHPKLRTLEDRVLLWEGGLDDKAVLVLNILGRAASSDELFELIGEDRSARGFRDRLFADDRVARVGKDSFGLAAWGDEQYRGLVPAMQEAIGEAGTPVDVDSLATDLEGRYGVSATSVKILAGTHPVFVLSGRSVRLRGDDEPYVPDTALDQHGACFMIDGAWAVRFEVNHDILRGSGTGIPEPFAVHLGVHPGQSGSIESEFGNVTVGWQQQPWIGSIRRVVQELDLVAGDVVFVRRRTPSELDFIAVPKRDRTGVTPEREICLLVGQRQEGRWQRVLADALGIGSVVDPTAASLRARFEQRRNRHIVELIDTLSRPPT